MLAEDEVRLALRAHQEGRAAVRDSLLTLAVADAGLDDIVWAERCRRWLVAGRPGHLYASFPTLGRALADPRVAEALERVRKTFPPVRVRHMLLRADAQQGPYTGRRESAWAAVEAIVSPSRSSRRDDAERGPRSGKAAASAKVRKRDVLMLMAVLLALALDETSEGTRAA